MNIRVEPEIMAKLMAIANFTHPQEFSGMAFARLEKSTIVVYDFALMDIGSTGWTEIPSEKLVKLMDRPDYANMKGWVHRHPVGNGKPGQHNWSGTDESTIQQHPLGGMPEMVGWSFSMVLTPYGWVGRIDNHIKHTVQHLEVTPSYAADYTLAREIVDAKRPKGLTLTSFALQQIEKQAREELATITDQELQRDWGMNRQKALETMIEIAKEAWVTGGVSEEDDAWFPEDDPEEENTADDWDYDAHTYLSQDYQDVQSYFGRNTWRQ